MKSLFLFAVCLIFFVSPVWASQAPPTTSPENVGSTAGMQFEQGWNYFKAGTNVCNIGQILNEIQANGGSALIATEIWVWEQNAWKQYLPTDTAKISQDTLLAFFSNQRLFFNLDPTVCTKNDAARQAEIGKLRNPNNKSFLDTVIDGVKNQLLSPFGLQKDINVSNFSAEFANFSDSLKVIGITQLANTTIGGKLTVGLVTIDDIKADISSLTGLLSLQNGGLTIDASGNASVSGTLKAKMVETNGVVLHDSVTKDTYCVQMTNGQMVTTKGACY